MGSLQKGRIKFGILLFLMYAMLAGVFTVPVMAFSERREIVFIDAGVQEFQAIAKSVRPGAEIIYLNGREDGLCQIDASLKDKHDIDAVHIISHGEVGQISLGNAILSSSSIVKYTNELKAIGSAMREDGELLIYGCEAAKGTVGKTFIEELSRVSGVNVAGSSDNTSGDISKGNSVLEVSTGFIKTKAIDLSGWNGVLGDVSKTVSLGTEVTLNAADLGYESYPNIYFATTPGAGCDLGIGSASNHIGVGFCYSKTDIIDAGMIKFSSNTPGVYSFQVRWTSALNLVENPPIAPYTNLFTITITVVNPAPTDIILSNNNAPAGYTGLRIGKLTSLDNYSDTNTFSIINDPDSLFSVSTTDSSNKLGELSFRPGKTLAAGVSSTVSVRVTDGASNTYDETFTITGAVPITLSTNSSALNNFAYTGSVDITDVSGYMDPEIGKGIVNFKDGGSYGYDPDLATVIYDAGGIYPGNNLVYTAPAASGQDTFAIGDQYYVVTIIPSNTAPSVSVNTGLTIDEDSVATAISNTKLQTTDSEQSAAALTYTLATVPAKGTLKNGSTSLSAADTFTQADIDANSITYTPAVNENGTDSFMFSVSDGAGGSTGTTTFNITINAVNDTPTDISLSNNIIAENTASGTQVGIFNTTDPDVGDTFNYSLESGTGDSDNTAFTISGNSLRLAVTPDFEAKSIYSIRVRSTDQGSLYLEKIFTINITNVNEAPIIANLNGDSVTYTEDALPVTLDSVSDSTVSDVDSANFDGGNITVSIVSNRVSTEDVLMIADEGTGAGQIGTSGSNVTYGGTLIGTYTGGTGTSDLVISLNSNASQAAVQALVRRLAYRNSNSANPSEVARTARITINDGDGATSSNADVIVNVSAVNDAPVISITGANADAAYNGTQVINISGTVTDEEKQSVVVSATINGITRTTSVDTNTTNSWALTWNISGLGIADGTYTNILFSADDGNGGTNTAAYTGNIIVDTLAPDTAINSTPPALSNSSTASFTFSSEAGAVFEVSIDGGAYVAAVSPKLYTGLSDGSHTFSVRAADVAGNVEAIPASYSWTIDTTAPDTTITANPSSITKLTSATFGFTSNDAGATFEGRLDGAAYVVITSPVNFSDLADGAHTFEVRAVDAAGNTDMTPASYTWTVDSTAPTLSISAPSTTLTANGDVIYTVSYSGADTITLANGDVTLNTTGNATGTVAVSGTGNTRLVTVSGITGDGTLSISIAQGTASDAAANMAAAADSTETVIVDNTVPTGTIAINNGDQNMTSADVTLSMTGSDSAGSGVSQMRFQVNGGSWSPWESFNAVKTGSIAIGYGTVEISMQLKDNAGNISGIIADSIIYKSIPVSGQSTKSGQEDSNIQLSAGDFTFSNDDGSQLTKVIILSLPAHATLKLGNANINVSQEIAATELSNITFIPDSNWYGATSFDWKGSDGVNYSISQGAINFNISAVNDTPIAANGSLTTNSGIAGNGTLSAEDADGDNLSYSIVSQGTKGTVTITDISTGAYTYTPNEGAYGNDSFTFKAADGSTDSNIATVTVNIIPAGVAELSQLSIGTGTLTPDFAANTVDYTVSVENAVSSIKIDAKPNSAYSTVKINNTLITDSVSGVYSKVIDLSVGENVIPVEVTAQDGTTKKTYTIRVTRAASSNAELAGIVLSTGALTPKFSPSIYAYTVSVANDMPGITITPSASNSTSTVRVNGVVVANGSTTGNIALSVGINTIVIEVTAQDNITKKIYNIVVTRVDAPETVSSGSGVNNAGTNNTTNNNTVDIQVNGKSEAAGTAVVSNADGKTVTTVTVDSTKVEQKLNQEGNNALVTIPVNNKSDVIVGELNGQTVKNMEVKDAVVQIKTENVTYTIPAAQINIDNISTAIGAQLGDIKVGITVAAPVQSTVKVVEDTADRNNYNIVVKPVEFNITCTSGGKTVEVNKFNGYVERTIAIPDGVNPNRITTGVVLNSDGTFSHVPTVIIKINGKYYAKINSLTNSTYSVIWNEKAFKDVENHWAKAAVNDMSSRLIINGVDNGKFEPDRHITRAEFATIVVKALGLMRTGTGKASYEDVSKNDWYYDAVSIASEYGLISGYGNGEFGPSDTVTREQAMTIIAKAMKITGLKVELSKEDAQKLLSEFGDWEQSSVWARENMAGCVKTGLVYGRDGSIIAPKDNITRAEAAVIVRKLLQQSSLI